MKGIVSKIPNPQNIPLIKLKRAFPWSILGSIKCNKFHTNHERHSSVWSSFSGQAFDHKVSRPTTKRFFTSTRCKVRNPKGHIESLIVWRNTASKEERQRRVDKRAATLADTWVAKKAATKAKREAKRLQLRAEFLAQRDTKLRLLVPGSPGFGVLQWHLTASKTAREAAHAKSQSRFKLNMAASTRKAVTMRLEAKRRRIAGLPELTSSEKLFMLLNDLTTIEPGSIPADFITHEKAHRKEYRRQWRARETHDHRHTATQREGRRGDMKSISNTGSA